MKEQRYLYCLVFVTGMSITAIELTASRALAPFFGTSLFVWANVIGVVLIGLAVGYAVGGRIADARPSLSVLLSIVAVAGVYSALIPIALQYVTRQLSSSIMTLDLSFAALLASFVSSVILFFPPVFLLAMASPFAIRLAAKDLQRAGHVAGTLYSVSTIGSILGVFLPSFVTVPLIGVRETFLGASALLLLIILPGFGRKRMWMAVLLLVPIGVFAFFRSPSALVWHGHPVLAEKDSAYQHLRVTDEPDGVALRINDGLGVQSIYDPSRVLVESYFDYYTLLPYLLPEKNRLDVLIIGLAGGTISRQLDLLVAQDRPMSIDGVEIDPEILSLAKRYFDLERPVLSVFQNDGRRFLASSKKKYDLIIVDAYSQQVYIPPHMATKEFFSLVKAHLNDDGIMAMNVNTFRDDAPLLRRMAGTLKSVYPEVWKQRLPDMTNVLLLGSRGPLSFASLPDRVPGALVHLAEEVRAPQTISSLTDARDIFTDNRAPIEVLTERMFFELLTYANNE